MQRFHRIEAPRTDACMRVVLSTRKSLSHARDTVRPPCDRVLPTFTTAASYGRVMCGIRDRCKQRATLLGFLQVKANLVFLSDHSLPVPKGMGHHLYVT
jgi:hypothetical protein